ncbi:MAG: helix-hairpin-helix domain-containing protein [Bacteroidota bacterium]|nr:helix-hairpin-helix domain-containing protein [Bacteroidota bacterium]
MKKILRDYFTFNKRERNGVFVLLSIIFILVVYLNVAEYFIRPEPFNDEAFRKKIEVLHASVINNSDTIENNSEHFPQESWKNKVEKKSVELFIFNPNGLPDKDWLRLGLSEKQIRSIKKFEAKGGTFRKKEDLKKMYCISPEKYAQLEPFIQLEDQQPMFKDGKVENLKTVETMNAAPIVVDLNKADSVSLTKLKGIGPFFAKNIIKYRAQLGGFISKEQLLEVWKFDQEKFDMVKAFLTVDASAVKKININTCNASELKHAYLKWNVVNAIINYRENHGKYTTVNDIRKTDLVDEETYRKIVPYLTTE